jgi:phosphoribosylcarboxyaminoimidazole (NCAIR) mutase
MSTDLSPNNISLLASNYPTQYNNLIAALQTVISNLETGNTAVLVTGLLANLSAANHKITNLANAVVAGDAMNLSSVQSLISGGGTPSNIPITDLGVGSANDGQFIKRSGNAIVGASIDMMTTESYFMAQL